MAIVDTTEINVTLSKKEAFYLTEALFSYEQSHIQDGRDPYLPVLLLELQRACNLEFDKTVTEKCKEFVK